MSEILKIGSKRYQKGSSGVFEVPLSKLDDLRFTEVPYYSTLEVQDLPGSMESYQLCIRATHAGGPGNDEFYLNFHVQFSIPGDWNDSRAVEAVNRRLRHVRRFFRETTIALQLDDGRLEDSRSVFEGHFHCHILFSRVFERRDDPVLGAVIEPFVRRFRALLESRELLLFICHASEDKPFVDSLCTYLDARDVPVWYDRREIKIGQSIVRRISEGLDSASHLLIVLSQRSVGKPWVMKELNSALMRQLHDASIVVVPVLTEDCSIPPLLADIKYADCRKDREAGFRQLFNDVLSVGTTKGA